MKITIFGSGSQLVEPIYRSARTHAVMVSQFDVTKSAEEIAPAIKDADAVINLAAKTNLELCEQDPKAAYKVNSEGALRVASVCEYYGVFLLHFSTDYVFSGPPAGYSLIPSDAPHSPMNIYGGSKALGEQFVLEEGGSIARVSWLIGKRFLKILEERDTFDLSATARPAFVTDVADAALTICENKIHGIHHLVNPPTTNRKPLLERVGGKSLQHKASPSPPVRPHYTPLAQTEIKLPDWKEHVRQIRV